MDYKRLIELDETLDTVIRMRGERLAMDLEPDKESVEELGAGEAAVYGGGAAALTYGALRHKKIKRGITPEDVGSPKGNPGSPERKAWQKKGAGAGAYGKSAGRTMKADAKGIGSWVRKLFTRGK